MRFVVYNPQSNGGATGRQWLEIAKLVEAAIGPFSSAPTCCRDDAARLVREAVANGAQEVVAVGGDGTISEAINGLFGAELPSDPRSSSASSVAGPARISGGRSASRPEYAPRASDWHPDALAGSISDG